mgnify:CR=1 FL=1
MNINRTFINLLILFFFSIIIFYLLSKQLIYPTIIPMVKNGVINLFADWSAIISANICDGKGFDVYSNNPCDLWNRKHVYGKTLLYFPYIESFPRFYFIYVPIILNLVFFYTVISFFNFKNKSEYFFLFLFLLNAPVILAIERANIDIVIFLLIVALSKNKNLIINYLILIFTSITKFYPISLGIIFLFEKKFKMIVINLLIFLITVSIILFFQRDDIIKIYNNQNQFSGSGIYEFSFIGGLSFIQNMNIYFDSKNYNFIKYFYIFLTLIIPLFITIYLNIRSFLNASSISNLFLKNNFENRLYILNSAIILVCYFSFSNFFYREIFFLGLIPWILKNRGIIENKFLNFYFYILGGKFLISTALIYITTNNIFSNLNPFIVITKHCIDFYLISIVLIIFIYSLKSFFTKLFYFGNKF